MKILSVVIIVAIVGAIICFDVGRKAGRKEGRAEISEKYNCIVSIPKAHSGLMQGEHYTVIYDYSPASCLKEDIISAIRVYKHLYPEEERKVREGYDVGKLIDDSSISMFVWSCRANKSGESDR